MKRFVVWQLYFFSCRHDRLFGFMSLDILRLQLFVHRPLVGVLCSAWRDRHLYTGSERHTTPLQYTERQTPIHRQQFVFKSCNTRRDRFLYTGSKNLIPLQYTERQTPIHRQQPPPKNSNKNLQYTEKQTPIHMQAAKTIPLQAWDWRGNGGSYTRVILIWFHVDRVMLFWFHTDRAILIWIHINRAMLIWINTDPVMLIWFL